MRIQDVKTFVVGNPPPHRGGRNWVFLRLRTDEGLVGYGEAYAVPFDARMVDDVGERLVVGKDPFRTELLWRTLYSNGYAQHPDLTVAGVLSAFEMACWDIVGKALGQPVYDLLGGMYHERLRSYTYLYAAGQELDGVHTDPDRAAERAAAYVEQGFTAIKLDPVGPIVMQPIELSLETLRRAETVVSRVREALATERTFWWKRTGR